ncbi:MAG: PqqD family protein [FCB group bacterium]|jgi:hypothetical protein|nr:PqqD family protein [FCB group bacterium]
MIDNAEDLKRQRLPRRRESVALIDCGSEALVHQEQAGSIVSLNFTARFILEYCDETRTKGDLVRAMMEEFTGADEPTVLADVDETLQFLVEAGLVDYGSS